MQRIKLLGLTLMAVFILGAFATATASALPSILPIPTAANPTFFKAKNKTGINSVLSGVLGNPISCTASASNGEFTSVNKGKATILFTGCTTNEGVTKCGSAGEGAGIIKFVAEVHLVDFTLIDTGNLGLGLLVLLPASLLAVECGIANVLVLGSVIGEFDGITTLETIRANTTRSLLFVEKEKGTQLYKTCDEPALCSGREFLLQTEFGKGEETSGEETTQKVSFGETVEMHF
jgi:hypothetical protein